MIKIRNLHKSFGCHHLLKGVKLDVKRGKKERTKTFLGRMLKSM
jgi:ABC-type histidine transport system ATPase subunit